MTVDFQSTALERLDFKSRVVQFPYGEVASATCADALAGSNAADAALAAPGASESSQSNAPWPLCILRHCRKSPVTAEGPSGCGALLAQNPEQSELARHGPVEAIPADQVAVPAAQTKAVPPLSRVASYRQTVNQLLTSQCGKSAGWVLWEPEAGDRLRPPGGRSVMSVPTGSRISSEASRRQMFVWLSACLTGPLSNDTGRSRLRGRIHDGTKILRFSIVEAALARQYRRAAVQFG